MDQNGKIENTTIAGSPQSPPATNGTKVCRTFTLFDQPEETDAFGSHKKVAEAIAALVEPEDAKGLGIGIEGPWGSGKSTVARLFAKELEPKLAKEIEEKKDENPAPLSFFQKIVKSLRNVRWILKRKDKTQDDKPKTTNDGKIVIVPFDAWAHEGDPLRRTFLETVITTLQGVGWVDKGDWDRRMQILANEREEVTTEDNISITSLGRVLMFTLLLVPIGGAFLNAALREPVTFDGGPIASKFVIYFILGLILSFGPLFVLVLGFKKQQDLLSLFLNKGAARKSSITSRTANPTSIEFEKNFMDLIKDALKGNNRRIVLILDNLDRVEAKDALSIWSTLQTFFQYKGSNRYEWHDRLWLLVLYDYGGLSQLWAKGKNQNDESENGENENGGNVALSFIDKSFQVRFAVPPLVLSDWRTFLTTQLKEAFPDHSDPNLHDVYRVLATDVAENHRSLTIRELKLFVNQIGAIHRQWKGSDPADDTFSLPLIAYYVIMRRHEKNFMRGIFETKELPPAKYQELLGTDIRESLAAIAFNVEVPVARQLMYSDKIKNALTLGDPKELTQVSELVSKGFWDMFEQMATDWTKSESIRVPEAALALEESGLVTNADAQSLRSVKIAFADSTGSIAAVAPLTDKRARGLGIILKWKKDLAFLPDTYESFTKNLMKSIALGLKEHAVGLDMSAVTVQWLADVNTTIGELDATTKLAAQTTLVEVLADQWKTAKLNATEKELCSEVLVELTQSTEVGATVEAKLKELADNEIGSELIGDESKSEKFVALLFYMLIRYSSAFTGLPTRASDPGERERELSARFTDSLAQSFVGLLEKYQQMPLLFNAAETSADAKPLAKASLKLAIKSPGIASSFTGPNAVSRLEFVFSELEPSDEISAALSKLLSELQPDIDVAGELTTRPFKPAAAGLYLQLLSSDRTTPNFVSWCIAGLRLVNADSWREHIIASDRLLDLAFYLGRSTEFELGEQYFQGLANALEIGIEVAWPTPPVEYENLASLIGPLESAFRYAFQDRIRDLIKGSTQLRGWFFQLVGPELIAQATSSRDLQVIEAFEMILARKERAGFEWLDQALKSVGTTLQQKYSSTPAWAKFRLAARRAQLAHRFNVETQALTTSIANFLQVKPLRNGVVVFAAFDGSRIVSLVPGSTEEETLIEHPLSEYPSVGQPVWSPDGKKIAFIATSVLDRDDIFVRDEASGEITKVTSGLGSNRQPSWSPDGKILAFTRVNDSKSDIYTIDLGTSEEKQLTDLGTAEHPSWSPDGRRMVFQQKGTDGTRHIVLMNAGGSLQNYRYEGSDPSWSPDGGLIAFVLKRGDSRNLCILKLDDDSSQTFIEEGDVYNPEWSPDNTKLLFQVGNDPDARIFQMDVNDKNTAELGKGVYPSWQPVSDGPENDLEPIAPSS